MADLPKINGASAIKRQDEEVSCALEYIYKKSPIESMDMGTSVADFRIELGRALASKIPSEIVKLADAVVPCPQTGIYYAIGLALALNIPYLPAVVNTSLDKRYLSVVNADERKKFIWAKLYPIKSLVENKNLLIVDEAIFTGVTLKILCEMLRKCNVNKIYLCIPSATCNKKCNKDVMPQKNILLENIRQDKLKKYFDADEVIFQDFNVFQSALKRRVGNVCVDCFCAHDKEK